ncbi:mercury(II) reductase [Paenibacillus sp. JMULE4]|uniref:Mercuric reductase n=1 Tax=Paenibacillus validus TaxID=44253 RepID=A0A7X3CUZ1_9BACL|nr:MULTISPECIES: mercury(II) reductase [Paenibacillus]MUG74002.1 mercury(II) reductase [Paenibacillus validus]NTZ19454.1 mercury(II) reductase [Paenibacillus sp. JMULE4]
MKKYRIQVKGMTCTGCEEHVATALEGIGARNIKASFRRGEATLELPDDVNIETAKQAINEAKYQSGDAEVMESYDKPVLDGKGDYDLLIIGSGGAAFSAAIKAVEHGAKVAIIERSTVGGTCVNIGCVPSKTLLRAGEIHHLAKSNPFLGLTTSAGSVDLAQLVEQKDELVGELRQHKYVDLIEEYGFELIRGEAKFIDEKTIEVNDQKFRAKRFLIATGASPSIPDIPGLQEVDYLTSTSLLELKQLPKTLAVIGSGYIAMELGQLFHQLGSQVTLLQRSPRLLKEYDPEISDAVTKALTEQGIQVITGVTYERVEAIGDLKQVYLLVNGEYKVVKAEKLLIATGRKPNTEALHLSVAGVKTGSRGEIIVDEYLRTANPNIYAAGDVTMGPQFVYVAAYEGGIAADNAIRGLERKVNLESVPGVTFTSPSIASVGLTEAQAKAKGYEVKTSVLPLDAVPRALVNRQTTGVFKLVADSKSLKVLGAHIVSENAGEVIYAATLAVKFGLTVEDLRESFAPYLTIAEGLKLAALTFDKDVSKLSCCAG